MPTRTASRRPIFSLERRPKSFESRCGALNHGHNAPNAHRRVGAEVPVYRLYCRQSSHQPDEKRRPRRHSWVTDTTSGRITRLTKPRRRVRLYPRERHQARPQSGSRHRRCVQRRQLADVRAGARSRWPALLAALNSAGYDRISAERQLQRIPNGRRTHYALNAIRH